MIRLNSNDMARLGCNDCNGCSDCCRGMGQSILLDPYDMFQLQAATGQNFAELMQEKIELCVEEGIILPALRMQPETDACSFLNREERCSIHAHRPGLCRLFPLGRKFDDDALSYFLLEDACQAQNRTKIKIKRWLDVPALPRYESFLVTWHKLRREVQEQISIRQSDSFAQSINVRFLSLFFKEPYDTEEEFYTQYEERKDAAYKFLENGAK